MKSILFLAAALLSGSAFSSQPVSSPAPGPQAAAFNFTRITVSAFVHLALNEATEDQYMLDPDLVKDDREISLRVQGKTVVELRGMLRDVLESVGYSMVTQGRLVVVAKAKPSERKLDERSIYVYRPLYRTPSYLFDLVETLVDPAAVSTRRGFVKTDQPLPPQGDSAQTSAVKNFATSTDVMVLNVTASQRKLLDSALPQLDTPVAEAMVSATLYEVSLTDQDASAWAIAASLFKGRFQVSLPGAMADNQVKLSLPGISLDAVASALQSDSRFKVVSNPRLRVKDGSAARLVVGSDVPTLGATSFPGNGATAVRSIEYQSAGVILDLKPHITREVVQLQVQQQLSSFVNTTTGVNDTPTRLRRELTSDVSVRPGELVVLGGLVDSKEDASRSGLPFWRSMARSASTTRTELLLVMNAQAL